MLTEAQLKVAALVAEGLANKEIASRLQITDATVKVHVAQAKERLGFRNRVQLAVWYVETSRRIDGPQCSRRSLYTAA